MRKMRVEIYPTVFATLLLISLCQFGRLKCSEVNRTGEEFAVVNETKGSSLEPRDGDDDSVMSSISSRGAKCLTAIKRWLVSFVDDALAGNPDNVRFFLYPNPWQREYAEEIVYGDVAKLEQSHFQSGNPVKIIIHGFTKNYEAESVQQIKDAYLARILEDSKTAVANNVILVDWEPIANPNIGGELFSYKYAVRNIPIVGQRVGEFVQFLMERGSVKSLKDVHIIGFSLGAHVAGEAGNTIRQLNAGQLPARITGLDPAGPAFYEGLSFNHRSLHKTDGKFVDVIHTSMGAYGTLEELGHADFYPNGGGPVQIRCEEEIKEVRATLRHEAGHEGSMIETLSAISSCSHGKAPEFFAKSILNRNMIACKCDSYMRFRFNECGCTNNVIFGEFCDHRTKGRFYLEI